MFSLLVAGVLVGTSFFLLLRHHRVRTRLYGELAKQRLAKIAQQAPGIVPGLDPCALRAEFERERSVRIEGFLCPRTLAQLQAESTVNRERAERSYIPMHKQGGTLSYEAIHCSAPGCLALYHSLLFRQWLSDVVGVRLQPTADHDQSSCSLLYYDRPGDHIGWHYDHNFYRGRHFTVLISLINRSASGGSSAARLQRRRDGQAFDIATPENTLIIFEGARVLHRATAVREGDERIMLSMTLCTDPRIGRFRELARRVKDTAYYGPRVLID